jgi:hypothetical protein
MKQSEQERWENKKKSAERWGKCNKMGKEERQMFVMQRLTEKT